tara:strand:+ start:89 stop:1342 length:1254 start_codon:yes stop_codon:yes gene_type:complete
MNPNVYSTKEIYPTSATTWTKNEKSNGTSNNGSSMNFNLNKYGIIEQILFSYTKNLDSTSTAIPATTPTDSQAGLKSGDIFDVIDRIELLSASRVISILTAADLYSQFSNLDTSQYEPIRRTATSARYATGPITDARFAVGATIGFKFVVPLVFGFMKDINLQLNSSFLEPLSIRVTYSANTQLPAAAVGTGASLIKNGDAKTSDAITDTFLNIRYKSYPESATAQILASNYNAPELVQVATRFYDENPVFKKIAQAGGSLTDTMSCDLRNTDCVESFYIMVRQLFDDGSLGYPVKLLNITYTGSGQEIMNLDEFALPYSRLTENGFSCSLQAPTADLTNMGNIYKIQTGLYEHAGGGVLSNTQSLREINAPRIEVTWDSKTLDAAENNWRLDVVEDCSAIYSTSSAVGRLSLALSN